MNTITHRLPNTQESFLFSTQHQQVQQEHFTFPQGHNVVEVTIPAFHRTGITSNLLQYTSNLARASLGTSTMLLQTSDAREGRRYIEGMVLHNG